MEGSATPYHHRLPQLVHFLSDVGKLYLTFVESETIVDARNKEITPTLSEFPKSPDKGDLGG